MKTYSVGLLNTSFALGGDQQREERDWAGPAWRPASLIHFGPIRAIFLYRRLTY